MDTRGKWQQLGAIALLCGLTSPIYAQSSTTIDTATPAEHETAPQESEAHKDGAASPHQVKPPVPISTPVSDIDGQWERAEVVLLLFIDPEGKVTSAELVSGEEPFAKAALEGAPNFRFEPALRGGVPAAAKIHFLLTFEPRVPPTPPAGETEEQSPTSSEDAELAPASEASGQALEEVIVLGKLSDPGSTSLTRAEVRNLAGAFDDPLRSIEVMPGVTPIASGLPLFFVRGAPPGNVGYFIDGIRVPLLYHAFLGPSVIHPAFIKQVTLSGGPIPTRFGRAAGASVEAELAAPEGRFRAETSVRLIDAGAFVEAPLNDGRGYALIGGRYSYTSLLVSLFSPGQRLDYWDYQALVGYAVSRKDELSVLTLGAFDYVGTDGEVIGGTEYHRIDLRWDHRFSKDTNARLAVTWGRDRTRSEVGFLSDNLLGSRFTLEHHASDVVFRSGGELWVDNYDMAVDAAISEPEIYYQLFPARTDTTAGLWGDFVLFPKGTIQIIPGIRADFYSSLGQERYSIDPRIFAQYQLTKNLRATHGLGMAHQSPNFVPSIPGAQVAGLEGGLQESIQASTEYEATLPWNLTGSLAFFLNTTKNMTDPIGLGQSLAIDETSADDRALGRAAGIEIYFKRPLTRHLGGIVSYTYSKALRSYDTITTVPGYDRPHVLNGAVTYDFGWNLRASAKASLASGIPGRRTTADGFVFDESRSVPYARLDLKLAKRWYVSETFFWGMHVEVLNATHSGSVSRRTCTVDTCKNEGTAPITFPSLGVEAVWQ